MFRHRQTTIRLSDHDAKMIGRDPRIPRTQLIAAGFLVADIIQKSHEELDGLDATSSGVVRYQAWHAGQRAQWLKGLSTVLVEEMARNDALGIKDESTQQMIAQAENLLVLEALLSLPPMQN